MSCNLADEKLNCDKIIFWKIKIEGLHNMQDWMILECIQYHIIIFLH